MLPEVVAAVAGLAREGVKRFRASVVAERAQQPVPTVQRDLVAMSKIGDLVINFEVMCPETGETVATYGPGQKIPKKLSSWECCQGNPFEVTPALIWVTYSPTESFVEQLSEASAPPVLTPEKQKRLRGRRSQAKTDLRAISGGAPRSLWSFSTPTTTS